MYLNSWDIGCAHMRSLDIGPFAFVLLRVNAHHNKFFRRHDPQRTKFTIWAGSYRVWSNDR